VLIWIFIPERSVAIASGRIQIGVPCPHLNIAEAFAAKADFSRQFIRKVRLTECDKQPMNPMRDDRWVSRRCDECPADAR
jgi:hypothetical protein